MTDTEGEKFTAAINECPFCGECEDLYVGNGGFQNMSVAVSCNNCGVEGPDIGFSSSVPSAFEFVRAILLWNGRARKQTQTQITVNINDFKS